jgi:succinate dehydrogenase flavin-adding protein (antitoxin of CptAB toxin-antitoxin module)
MANNSTLRKVFNEVLDLLDSDQYEWVSEDREPDDYFDWGFSYLITAQDIIDDMIDEGDVVLIQHA